MNEKQTAQANKSIETSELEFFVNDIKNSSSEELEEKEFNARVGEYATRLVMASLEDEDDNALYPINIDRRTKSRIRDIIPAALSHIKQESDGDEEFENEITSSIVRSLGRVSIPIDSIPSFSLKAQKQKNTHKHKENVELTPHVAKQDRQFLQQLTSNLEKDGKWTTDTTVNAAKGFINIYHPAEEKINSNKSSHQEVLDAIAACGTYSHAIAAGLSTLSPLEQTSRIDDIKAEIVKQLIVGGDDRLVQRLSNLDDYTLNDVPEIKEFIGAIKGAQYEVLAHDAISKNTEALGFDEVSYSSMEDDITNGFDLVIKQGDKTYHVDIKAAGSFRRSTNKYPEHIILNDQREEGYIVRKPKHVTPDGNSVPIIVIDAETSGKIGVKRNRIQLQDPQTYLGTLKKAITAVDNVGK